jgi:hypothetical protein
LPNFADSGGPTGIPPTVTATNNLAAEIHDRTVKRRMAMRLPPMRQTGFPAMFGYEQSIRHHARF